MKNRGNTGREATAVAMTAWGTGLVASWRPEARILVTALSILLGAIMARSPTVSPLLPSRRTVWWTVYYSSLTCLALALDREPWILAVLVFMSPAFLALNTASATSFQNEPHYMVAKGQ